MISKYSKGGKGKSMEQLYFGMIKTNSQNYIYKKGQNKKNMTSWRWRCILKKKSGGNVTGIQWIFGIRISPTRGIWCRVAPAAEFC